VSKEHTSLHLLATVVLLKKLSVLDKSLSLLRRSCKPDLVFIFPSNLDAF
jgi:hypothetical protein